MRQFMKPAVAMSLAVALNLGQASAEEASPPATEFSNQPGYMGAISLLSSTYSTSRHKGNWQNYSQGLDKIDFIIRNCIQSNAMCADSFDRYYRENQEHAASGGFLGIFSAQSFWGTGQELHYTEVEMPSPSLGGRAIEFQVGYGYIIAARQVDANMSGKGFLQSTPASIKGKAGGTRFWSMIAGLAPDKIRDRGGKDANCGTDDLAPQSEMLCTLDMQPTVTQRYFRDASARLANAMDRVRRNYRDEDGRTGGQGSQICPQVIDFRWKKADLSGSRSIMDSQYLEEILPIARAINDLLSVACANKRPNAKIVYRDGRAADQWNQIANGAINLGDGGATEERKNLVQEYIRSSNYLLLTARISKTLENRAIDHGVEIKMEGLIKTAKLPSILASIVNFEREDISQHLTVKLQCSGGSHSVAVPTNPVANAIAYTQLVDNARRVVDGSGDGCKIASRNFK